jgi:hypothetical protein
LWLIFCAAQLLGWILVNLASAAGHVGSQSPFVAVPWLAGVVLLFPGFALAVALDEYLNRVPTLFIPFLVTVACNAIFWVACSAAWRKLRGKRQV